MNALPFATPLHYRLKAGDMSDVGAAAQMAAIRQEMPPTLSCTFNCGCRLPCALMAHNMLNMLLNMQQQIWSGLEPSDD